MAGGEEVRATRTIGLVTEMRDNAHVAEAMATRGEKRVRYDLHAYRTQHVLVHVVAYCYFYRFLRRFFRRRLRRRSRWLLWWWWFGGGVQWRLAFNGGDQCASHWTISHLSFLAVERKWNEILWLLMWKRGLVFERSVRTKEERKEKAESAEWLSEWWFGGFMWEREWVYEGGNDPR